MIRLDAEDLLSMSSFWSGISEEYKEQSNKLTFYRESLLQKQQGFLTCIDDQDLLRQLHSFQENPLRKKKLIYVLGIGGSALGARMLQDALGTSLDQQITILDTIDPMILSEIIKQPLEESVFIIISKSGGTQETIAQYLYFKHLLQEKNLSIKEHMIIITDEKKGFLRKEALSLGITSFHVPRDVGGRFSVLTSVGLVPALYMGISIEKLLKGALHMREQLESDDPKQNIPFQLALLQYAAYMQGKTIHVLFPYAQKLNQFSFWWQQLLAESIGKTEAIGITPLTSVGPRDQHSLLQLYHDGPKDKFFLFVDVEDMGHPIHLPHIQEEEFAYLSQRTFEEIVHAEKTGTEQSLLNHGHPVVTISLSRLDEEELGGFIFLMESTIAFLGELFHINAFDQPGVEQSKVLSKQVLIG